jgi:hypothetical protein
MQKRRMWKAAIAYFALSLLCVAAEMLMPENFNHPTEMDRIRDAFSSTLLVVFVCLQPWILFLFKALSSLEAFCGRAGIVLFIAVLMFGWSLCVAWLLIKLDNWLNHFPVLGKRVF